MELYLPKTEPLLPSYKDIYSINANVPNEVEISSEQRSRSNSTDAHNQDYSLNRVTFWTIITYAIVGLVTLSLYVKHKSDIYVYSTLHPGVRLALVTYIIGAIIHMIFSCAGWGHYTITYGITTQRVFGLLFPFIIVGLAWLCTGLSKLIQMWCE